MVASLFAIKIYSLDCIRKPTKMPGSILSSDFVRSVNGPTRNHTLSPNTHLPMWCPRPHHRSNGAFLKPNCIQVQQVGGVHNHPSNGLRFWWYLHLTIDLKLILECPNPRTRGSMRRESDMSSTRQRAASRETHSCPYCSQSGYKARWNISLGNCGRGTRVRVPR